MKYFWIAVALILPQLLLSQQGIIKGRVINKLNNEPIEFANVFVQGASVGTITDLDGSYEITGLEPGLYDVEASFLGFTSITEYEIQVSNSKPAEVVFELEEASEQLDEVVVKASPFKKTEESPLSLRSIGIAEIQRNPGGGRDISKVVQSLPGVTTSASFRNDLIIRGGSPNENRFYLDGVEVPNINHFATQGASGGPVGLINVNFIREVDFFSGAFPANRGNSLSSVFDFKQRDGRDDRIGGSFTIGASDLNVTLEGPIGDKTTYLVSARRSYLQFLFRALELPFLPIYNDFQAKVKHKINQKNEITFIGLGAIDQFQLNLDANQTESQQYLLANLPVSPQWNYTNGLVYKRFNDAGYWTFVVSRNMLNNESYKYFENDESSEDNLIFDYKSQEIENKLRIENTTRLNGFKFNIGINYEYAKYNNATFQKLTTPFGPTEINYASAFNLHRYGAFGQIGKKFLDDRLSVSAGLRIDGNSYSEEMMDPLEQFSPRLSLSYSITDRISFNANTGIYYQLPAYTLMGFQQDGVFTNKENGIRYIRNTHFVAGLEFNTASSSKFTVEAYYKKYNDYPFLLRDSISIANLGGDFGIIGNEPAVSISEGTSYGFEFLFQQRLYKGFYGIGSYTLGWSEFGEEGQELIASSWDARHIVNVTFGKRFKNNWEAGIAYRYQSGIPYTPFATDSDLVQNWNINNRGIRDFNQLNTLRGIAATGFDFRVDKKWFFDKWSLNVYLDVENVFGNNPSNPELILDRPLDENNVPIGSGIIDNPNDPIELQRYRTKLLEPGVGVPLPTLGLVIEI